MKGMVALIFVCVFMFLGVMLGQSPSVDDTPLKDPTPECGTTK